MHGVCYSSKQLEASNIALTCTIQEEQTRSYLITKRMMNPGGRVSRERYSNSKCFNATDAGFVRILHVNWLGGRVIVKGVYLSGATVEAYSVYCLSVQLFAWTWLEEAVSNIQV